MAKASLIPNIAPLLVDANAAAEMAGISPATWWRRFSEGKTPNAVKPSPKCTRWRYTDLAEWIELGCPPRTEFEALRATRRREVSR